MRRLTLILASSIALCLGLDSAAQQMDRGYVNKQRSAMLFAPEGSWLLGGSAAFSMHSNDGLSFAVLDGINSKGYNLSVAPTFCYMIKDNVGTGMKLSYGREFLDLSSASLSVAGTDLSWEDYYAIQHDFGASFFLRNYIPVDRSGRMAIFVDLQLTGERGQAKIHDLQNGNVIGTYSTISGASLSINPGAVILLSKHFALDAGLKVLNIGYNVRKQTHNQVSSGDIKKSDFSYSLDFLSLKLGLYYYL